MSMDYVPNHAWIITPEDVAKIVPNEYRAFCEALDDEDLMSLEKFCDLFPQRQTKKVNDAWTTLVNAFESATQVDGHALSLYPCYKDREQGSRYDDADANGAFFIVSGVQTITPAGQKFAQYIKEALWTTFG